VTKASVHHTTSWAPESWDAVGLGLQSNHKRWGWLSRSKNCKFIFISLLAGLWPDCFACLPGLWLKFSTCTEQILHWFYIRSMFSCCAWCRWTEPLWTLWRWVTSTPWREEKWSLIVNRNIVCSGVWFRKIPSTIEGTGPTTIACKKRINWLSFLHDQRESKGENYSLWYHQWSSIQSVRH